MRWFWTLATLSSFVLFPSELHAQTMPDYAAKGGGVAYVGVTTEAARDLQVLWTAADVVVRGKIETKRSRLSTSQKSIFTDYELRVSAVVRSKSPELISQMPNLIRFTLLGGSVDLPGGTVGLINTTFPLFDEGEEYVLFLRRQGDNPQSFEAFETPDPEKFVIVYGAQGAFHVVGNRLVPHARPHLPIAKRYSGKRVDDFAREVVVLSAKP